MLTEQGEKKLKSTKARTALLSLLKKSEIPLGVGDILVALPKGIADRTTVHRTMVELVKRGLVREVALRHGHTDYEIVADKEHHHIVCVTCGFIEDVDCQIEDVVKRIGKSSTKFARIDQHSFELFGVCKKCA